MPEWRHVTVICLPAFKKRTISGGLGSDQELENLQKIMSREGVIGVGSFVLLSFI